MIDNKTIKVNELKQGDILLFSYLQDDWESKLIALLTQSPVSHSAMSYYTNDEIVEETPPDAQVNPIKKRVADRTITVMRFSDTEADLKKVLDVAKKYADLKEPYPMANLIFVGLYILLKRVIISKELQILLLPILKLVIGDLIELVDNKYYPGEHPMVCSQFIYHCYEEAGKEYKLIVRDIPSLKCLLEQVQNYINENKSRLELKLATDLDSIKAGRQDAMPVTDKLLEALYQELKKTSDIENRNNSTDLLGDEFVMAVHEFCSVIYKLYNNEDALLVKNEENILSSNPIASLLEHKEYFVTPGDLLTNCKNLTNMGTLME
ncbi:MAG: hypothetical protein WCD89_06105 [Anaerocolumna sp.]